MRRITVSNANKTIIAKDPLNNKDQKLQKLINLMQKYGFKIKEKSRNPYEQKHGLMEYSLTLFGQYANVVVTRNEGALGSNSPLKILIYIPTYDGMCGDWKNYFKGIEKINQFLEKAKEIDPSFLD